MIRRLALGAAVLVLVVPGAAVLAGVGGLHPLQYPFHPLRTDFALYYRDAQVGWQDGWSNMYSLTGFDRVTRALGIVNADPRSPSLSLPLMTWLVAPVALLPLRLAYAVWLLLLVAAFLGSWWIAAPGPRRERAVHLLLAACFPPAVFGVVLGQASVLVAAAVIGCWALLRAGREWTAGTVLGLLWVKPQLAFLVPVALLLAGRRRAVLAFCGVSTILAAAVLAVIPIPALAAYADRITAAFAHPSVWRVAPDLTLWGLQPHALAWGLAAATLLAVGWIGLRLRGDPRRDELALAAGLLGSLLAAPYLHLEDLALLLPAGWLFLRAAPSPALLPLLVACYLAGDLETIPGLGLPRIFEAAWLVALALSLSAPLRLPVAPARSDGRMAVHADP